MRHAQLVEGPGPAVPVEPGEPVGRRARVLPFLTVATLVAMVTLVSLTFLGRAASSKFAGVGSAISGGGPVGAVGAAGAGAQGAPTATAAGAGPAPSAAPYGVDALSLPPAATAGHDFVSTATVSVRSDDLAQTKARAIAAAEARGGGLFGESSTFGSTAKVELTLKVPPDQFRSTLSALEGLGETVAEEVHTDDVTDKVVDLDARIGAAAASLDRTRLLLDKASSLTDIALLDGEVSRRQAELENLRGQQRTLGARTALATITATFLGPGASPATTSTTRSLEPTRLPGFADGLTSGWKAFTDGGSVSLAVVGAVLPFGIVLGPLSLVLWWRSRRRRRSRPEMAAGTSTGTGPAVASS